MNLNLRIFEFCNVLRMPFSVQRWRSSPDHNKAVGGAPKSKHITGDAADLTFDTVADLEAATEQAIEMGFEGVEMDVTNNHLHIDVGPRVWRVLKTSHGYSNLPARFLSSSPA